MTFPTQTNSNEAKPIHGPNKPRSFLLKWQCLGTVWVFWIGIGWHTADRRPTETQATISS